MKHRILMVFFTLVVAGTIFGQSSVTATHAAGQLPTYYGEYNDFCSSFLVVDLPAGNWNVTSVDVQYIMTATSQALISQQRSKLNCLQGTEETTDYVGPIGGSGQYPYSRSGLSIANGVHSGSLTFQLKAYRTFGNDFGLCDALSYNYVDGEFYKVTVWYEPAPACATPTSLFETNITDNAAQLSWTENGSATSWDIEYGATPYTFTGTPTVTGISNPHNLSNLLSSTEYTWKVRSNCITNTSDWSSSNTFTTACPVPTSLSENNILENSAELSWMDNGSATSWDIEYGVTPYTFTGTPTVTGITNPYNLSNLLSSTEYTWKVRSNCGINISDWSSSNTFTTPLPVPISNWAILLGVFLMGTFFVIRHKR